jgi:histidinol-phosphatase (PHP family)
MSSMFAASYHTHNEYCDGQGRIEEMVEAAISAGLTEIGISSHAPLPFETEWNMSAARLSDYVAEVGELQRRYRAQITVLLGVELDFIPDQRVLDFQRNTIFPLDLDYLIGSIHFLGTGYPPRTIDGTEEEFREILQDDYQGHITAMATDYYRRVRQMLDLPGLSIIGHLDRFKLWNADHRYFTGDEAWYRETVGQTLRTIAISGQIVELNTGGWRKGFGEGFPAPWILEHCRELGIPVTISSDAHAPDQVTIGFEQAQACLDDLGITPVRLSND